MPLIGSGGSSVSSANITDGTIVDADISASAAIQASKITGKPYETLADVTADGSSGTLSTGTFTAKTHLRVILFLAGTGNGGRNMRYNNDSGANYDSVISVNSAASADTGATTSIDLTNAGSTALLFLTMDILNISNVVKHTKWEGNQATDQLFGTGNWNNVASQITRIDILAAVGTITAGSRLVVLGMN